ncbi:hydrogenase expression/formation protein HypE [Prosthecochloris sp. HL-130-GSB]|jgi:hydrogenase expression/formation protein HypE|uniref:hydrogenase expression/formation protein HypE n=1 Tax=Prosthecochloris sp. HL-130-GSB TaxID=1974213 RepID=UPI000A1C0E68|nr:hydrogenase expression/formation protein HypE [Prosthecochloris sp. HL-130-GSB]ARM30565.1 hydrogenase expression/formation protein HypE [Prosthecochloris sp. HL-130-GSB]MBO8093288.1 hydrogenase expression/formation protein HypE [Prosthecochloris sp.]
MQLHCPLPGSSSDVVQMAHGAGGRLSRELMEKVFLPHLSNSLLESLDDQAKLSLSSGNVAFTTDSYVVSPLFFPGGTIGELAVYGTVNDLAVGGAVPEFLSAGFVIEEGFAFADLEKIVVSFAAAARKAGVQVVTGDTKVVERGKCDGVYITTSGIGVIREDVAVSCRNLVPGDVVILSGSIGDHGISVLAAREGLSLQSGLESDSAPLHAMIASLLDAFPGVHAMRDPTRGGVAAALNELASASGVGIELDEDQIPVKPEVKGACELLGIDPVSVANEGKVLVFVPERGAEPVLEAMKAHKEGMHATLIGRVVAGHPGQVVMKTVYGSRRVVDMPLGEQLPRIC